eukprot:XP_001694852.1 predicted protein [Chlamydomonas reinhardtii]
MTQPQVIHVPRSRQAIKQQSASLIATLLVLVGVAVALLPLGPSNAPLGQQFVTAPESAVKTTGAVDKHWWNREKDVWVEVHTEEDFRREVSTGSKLVAVDFFATWCHGCEKSYPEICRVVKDAELQKKYKFVKVVFTKSATDGLKLVGETFPWSQGSMFRYLRENHNSVLGVREYALQGGGAFQAVNETFVDRWALRGDPSGDHDVWLPHGCGRAHRQDQCGAAHAQVFSASCTAFPNIPATPPFQVFWGGGTVALATSEDNFHVLKCKPSDRLEDGTVAFLDVIAVKHGIAMMNGLGGITRVQAHVASLTEWLYSRLSGMRHSNGSRMLAIFGKHHLPNHRAVQGGILNFELLRPDGSILSYKTFEREAATAGFHVRTGAECNPGACYNYLGVKEAEVESLAGKKEGCEDDVEFITVQRPVTASQEDCVSSSDLLRSIANSNLSLNHPAAVALKWMEVPLGSVRVSLGWWSTFDDVYALGDWIERTYRDRTE